MSLTIKRGNAHILSNMVLILMWLLFSPVILASDSSIAKWAKSVVASSDNSVFNSVAVDSNGNIYASGFIYGNNIFDFGNGVTVKGAYETSNVVLVKYDSSGNAKWAKSVLAGLNISNFNSVAVDSSGNIYASGSIDGNNIFDLGNSVTVKGAYETSNVILVKYDSSGNAQWAKSVVSGSSSSNFNSVVVDNSGNIYASGSIAGSNIFDFGNSVTVQGTYKYDNVVLVKYDSNGNTKWAKSVVSGSGHSNFNSVAVDSSGNIYASGYIDGNNIFDFGNDVTVTASYRDSIVLVKYDSSGNAQWAKSVVSGSGNSSFTSVAIDNDGNIYASGYIEGTKALDFGNGVIVRGAYNGDNGNVSNIVLVKYDSSGNAQWAKSVVSGSSYSNFNSVAVDSSGNIYASGYIYGNNIFDFGNGVTVKGAYESGNIVLVKYDSSGNPKWARSVVDCSDYSNFKSVAINSNENIYAAGYIGSAGTFDFGDTVKTSGACINRGNVILVKYSNHITPTPTPKPTPTPTPSHNNSVLTWVVPAVAVIVLGGIMVLKHYQIGPAGLSIELEALNNDGL